MSFSKLKESNKLATNIFGGKLSNSFVVCSILGSLLFIIAVIIENLIALNGWCVTLYICSIVVFTPALREFNLHAPE